MIRILRTLSPNNTQIQLGIFSLLVSCTSKKLTVAVRRFTSSLPKETNQFRRHNLKQSSTHPHMTGDAILFSTLLNTKTNRKSTLLHGVIYMLPLCMGDKSWVLARPSITSGVTRHFSTKFFPSLVFRYAQSFPGLSALRWFLPIVSVFVFLLRPDQAWSFSNIAATHAQSFSRVT